MTSPGTVGAQITWSIWFDVLRIFTNVRLQGLKVLIPVAGHRTQDLQLEVQRSRELRIAQHWWVSKPQLSPEYKPFLVSCWSEEATNKPE